MLAALALVHLALVQRDALSPWLGGGFGMFSTVDRRHLVAIATDVDGSETVLDAPHWLEDGIERARALPSEGRLGALADAGSDAAPGCAVLRIEVWRSDFAPGSLAPTGTRLAGVERPCPTR